MHSQYGENKRVIEKIQENRHGLGSIRVVAIG